MLRCGCAKHLSVTFSFSVVVDVVTEFPFIDFIFNHRDDYVNDIYNNYYYLN